MAGPLSAVCRNSISRQISVAYKQRFRHLSPETSLLFCDVPVWEYRHFADKQQLTFEACHAGRASAIVDLLLRGSDVASRVEKEWGG